MFDSVSVSVFKFTIILTPSFYFERMACSENGKVFSVRRLEAIESNVAEMKEIEIRISRSAELNNTSPPIYN